MVQLARGDFVAAEKAFKEWGNCCDSDEVQTLEILLQAFDDEDAESAKRALAAPFIRHMDVEYSILARDIPLPHGLATTSKADVIKDAARSYMSPNTEVNCIHLFLILYIMFRYIIYSSQLKVFFVSCFIEKKYIFIGYYYLPICRCSELYLYLFIVKPVLIHQNYYFLMHFKQADDGLTKPSVPNDDEDEEEEGLC